MTEIDLSGIVDMVVSILPLIIVIMLFKMIITMFSDMADESL